MDPATVFFTDFRCSDAENLQRKFTRLLKTAGLAQLDLAGKFVAVKTHFGEGGCLAYLRPNWAKTLVDFVKAQGGRPFLTDANTLYVGRRKDALEHLELAWENGFSPFSVGCPILIADGLRGTDDVAVPLPDGKYVKEAFIGRALVDADVVISLSHFKCHEMTGIGGALKSGKPHDGRAPDYDDWDLNGDILFWCDWLGCAVEVSSMGIRVDPASLDRQLTLSGHDERRELPYHKALLNGELPLTIGGGIGQSRISMLLLGKAHIGEVQASIWDDETMTACEKAGITLL